MSRRRRALLLTPLILLLVALILFVVLWTQRRQIATDYLERELERRGVQASYTITRIGFRTERIADVVIGDPARPDLTAKWAEVKIEWTLRGPKVGKITARGVRMFGRVVDGQLSLGQVDRLLPPKSGKPFAFPDQDVDVADTAIAVDTDVGRIAMAIEGKGNLSNGFRGDVAARSSRLMLGGCAVDRFTLNARVAIRNRHPSLHGPLSAARLLCAGRDIDLDRPQLQLDATVPESLNRWRGAATLQVPVARIAGNTLRGVAGRVRFEGTSKVTRGAAALAVGQGTIAGLNTGRASIAGRYAIADGARVTFMGDASAANVAAGDKLAAPVADALSAAGGTPLEPIADALSQAVARASRDLEARASLTLVNGPGYGAVRIEQLAVASASGAKLGFSGEGLDYHWVGGGSRFNGELGLSGGGLPATRVRLTQARAGAALEGEARIAPYSAGNARIALAPISFRAGANGVTRVETAAILSGPFSDGYVTNLGLPIRASFGAGGFSFGEGCTTAVFSQLRVSSLTLGPSRLPLCPTGRALIWKGRGGTVQGGADLRSLRLAGRLGSSPIAIAAANLRLAVGSPNFTGTDVAVRIGQQGSVNALDAERLDGRFVDGGVRGRFSGLDGKIANVPLLVSQGAGDWSLIDGRLTMNGGVTVSDELAEPRFYPLVSDDFRLTLIDNRIAAKGLLHDPETGTKVLTADIIHDLGTGTGRALLDVPGITFDPEGYQPEELTRLTTGVVALVDGTLTGKGAINWSPQGTSSTGTFSVADMNLAAPFGPVEGLTTTVNFTDLLGLTSAPGQVATVDIVRTGIDVVDGAIRYQLLPEQRVKVESGIWPFMGGQLVLEETILDFSKPTTKRLVFRAIGLDGATFISEMEFANIELTGTFDGVLPMEFDESGGRIVDGRLSARAPGGSLSYIGELTDKQLGTFGKMAFDALKSFRYSKLDIGLTGALDGEFLAGIELDGLARNEDATGGIFGNVLNRLAKLPFEFNINIRGPFRALIGTARSFSDPSDLIQPVLPQALQGLPTEVVEQDKDEQSTTTGEPEPEPVTSLIQDQESEGEQ